MIWARLCEWTALVLDAMTAEDEPSGTFHDDTPGERGPDG